MNRERQKDWRIRRKSESTFRISVIWGSIQKEVWRIEVIERWDELIKKTKWRTLSQSWFSKNKRRSIKGKFLVNGEIDEGDLGRKTAKHTSKFRVKAT